MNSPKNSLSKILNIETLQKYTHLFYLDSRKKLKRTMNKEKKNMIVGILKLSINTSICPIWAHWIIFPSHKFGRPFINHIVSAPNKANLIHQPNKELRRRDRFFQGYIFLFCYKSQDAHFHFTETFKQTCFINKEKNHKKGRQFFLSILDGGLPKMVICLGLFGFWYFKKMEL